MANMMSWTISFLFSLAIISGSTRAACPGTCKPVSAGCDGYFQPGECPGPSSTQCCIAQSCNGGKGYCINVDEQKCSGSLVAGLCPGASNIECCESGSPPPPPSPPSPSRDTIIARCKSWVDARIPYCQCNSDCCGTCPYCGSYRCDCSGYATYALQLPPGQTTSTLPRYSHIIAAADLLPGDLILNPSDHVIIFAGWVSSSHNSFYGYQEAGCSTNIPVASLTQIGYPIPGFSPYRKNGLDDNVTGVPSPFELKAQLSYYGWMNFTEEKGWFAT